MCVRSSFNGINKIHKFENKHKVIVKQKASKFNLNEKTQQAAASRRQQN